MPLLAINLSDMLFAQIKEFVEKGRYTSFEAFIEIAAFNQLALERGATPAELVERGHRKIRHETTELSNGHAGKTTSTTVTEPPPKKSKVGVARRPAEPVARVAPPDETALTPEVVGAAFKRLTLAIRTAESPKPIQPTTDEASDERVFGQVNRLMPLKLVCRWLATWAAAEGKWPRYELVSDALADDAATVGSLLDKWDIENERKRDELLATGLPRRGNSASRDRFLSQFLARVTRGGEIYPAVICQYRLAKFEDSVIALTDLGQAFSNLENPILDTQDKKASSAMSELETEYLETHIRKWVPTEWADMKTVLVAVQMGKTSPTEVATAVRTDLPKDWTNSMVQTHISGVIARLSDIHLLRRIWQGRNVRYELGDNARVKPFLEL